MKLLKKLFKYLKHTLVLMYGSLHFNLHFLLYKYIMKEKTIKLFKVYI